MKRFLVTLSICAFVLSANAQYRQCFDEGWKFFRGAAINAESMDFDDSKWREVTVPHDYMYGYRPFVVKLNDILKDKTNRNVKNEREVTIVVKSVNQGLNCRWYAGSGIYRHVWLETNWQVAP